MQLPLLCEKTGALPMVEPGLTAGSRLLGRRNCCKVRNFKFCIQYIASCSWWETFVDTESNPICCKTFAV